jgi:hypothetical protein
MRPDIKFVSASSRGAEEVCAAALLQTGLDAPPLTNLKKKALNLKMNDLCLKMNLKIA